MNKIIIRVIMIILIILVCSCEIFELPGVNLMEVNIKKEDAAGLMQDFIIGISEYAKALKPGFLIIPQNGSELVFKNAKSAPYLDSYIDAIDGLGIEELFYNSNGNQINDKSRIQILTDLKKNKNLPVLVSDYLREDSITTSIQKNKDAGFIAYPRNKDNYHYSFILPISSWQGLGMVSSGSIQNLSDAKNYLYLISDENYLTKTSMLNAIKNTVYDVIIIDLFYNNTAFTLDEIKRIQTKSDDVTKRLVIAYINVGAAETFRYYWSEWKNPPFLVKRYFGYPDEYWAGYWTPEWQKLIFNNGNAKDLNDKSYIKKIIDAGFDGAYLDNVEAYMEIFEK